MTDGFFELSSQTRLEKQPADILETDTEPLDLVQQLDFDYLKHCDTYAEWHTSGPLLPSLG